jgi:RNA polymerase sigma-70 factor, ECF subfamily
LIKQYTDRTDEQLMCDYKQGETAAFDALYQRHKGGLYRYFTRQLDGQTALAHEMYQDVWMRVIQSRERYETTALFTTWLYHIAHNILIDFWRSQRPHDSIDEHEETLQSNTHTPDIMIEHHMTAMRLKQALVNLPRDQLNAFLLKEEGNFSLEDIASITGTTRETVKSRLRYAMDKLRSALS